MCDTKDRNGNVKEELNRNRRKLDKDVEEGQSKLCTALECLFSNAIGNIFSAGTLKTK